MKVTIILSRDEDGMFIAECPFIPGCVSQGKTARAALKNIREAAQACLKVRARKRMPLTMAALPARDPRRMPPVPVLKRQAVIKALTKLGWQVSPQRASPISILTKPGRLATISVPKYSRVARQTLCCLIVQAGMTVEEFLAALE